MNEAIDALVDEVVPDTDPEMRHQLKAAFTERESQLCDALRLHAANEGLAPSITALTLVVIGMGPKPSAEEIQMLEQQAAAERAVINEALRRFQEGGEGSGSG